MISNSTVKHLRLSFALSAVLALLFGTNFASGFANAADPTTSEEAIAEMQEMLGGVPTEIQLYPESARAAGWAMMKSTDLNKDTALPSKLRELIGLAVAAQIPCQYCVHYHIKAAKAAGASEEEILSRAPLDRQSCGTGA